MRGASKQEVYSASRQSGSYIDSANDYCAETEIHAEGGMRDEPRNMRDDTNMYASRITDDIELNDYSNDPGMQELAPNDYNKTLVTDLSQGSIYMNVR